MSDDRFAGSAVLITGAAGGIGRATSRQFAARGAHVVCTDVDEVGLAQVIAEISADGGIAVGIATELGPLPSLEKLLDDVEAAVGQLDVLVQLAAVLRRQSIDEVTEADWDLTHFVNARASFFLGRAFAQRLQRAGRSGAVVNSTSQSWQTGGFGGAVVYAASKGAMVSATRGLARIYAPSAIRFNLVAPGFVDTDMLRDGLDELELEKLCEQVPLGRLATPDEVAAAILFLASPEATYITGTTIVVTGGQLMH